jgi:mono/diheme cytochrome c family protein
MTHTRLTTCTALILLTAMTIGCEQQMSDMYKQPKLQPLDESTLWPDHRASRPLPQHTVAYSAGAIADASSGRLQVAPIPYGTALVLPGDASSPASQAVSVGTAPAMPTGASDPTSQAERTSTATAPAFAGSRNQGTAAAQGNKLPITPKLLARGRERFDIYCAPCHGYAGRGDGMVARRGFPHPPSYHIDRLREAPDMHFIDVMTHGYGVMYPYADRISRADRWAIVAYIRALQLSQHARLEDVPEKERAALAKARR